MPLMSMTGFARAEGHSGLSAFTWEIKSVNGKGLDVRLRLPYGFDELELEARKCISAHLKRGNVNVTLTLTKAGAGAGGIDIGRLSETLHALRAFAADHDLAPPSMGDLLSVRSADNEEPMNDEVRTALKAALMAGLERAVKSLSSARRREGEALHAILVGHIDEIEALTAEAAAHDFARIEAIQARFRQKVADLLVPDSGLDPQRLEGEIALLAMKADIREELDRLGAHIVAAHTLLAQGDNVGRQLDFLAQEFNREANTMCSKSGDTGLTAIGLKLKTAIDRMREQIQNVE